MPETAARSQTDLSVGVNEPSDPRNLSELEKMHIPLLRAPQAVRAGEFFELEIEVGNMRPHPSEHRHFIHFIDIYADHTFLARADLTAVRSRPKLRFCLMLDHPCAELRVYASCNLHGTWVGRKPIVVEG